MNYHFFFHGLNSVPCSLPELTSDAMKPTRLLGWGIGIPQGLYLYRTAF